MKVEEMKKYLIMLAGLPCTGKSTVRCKLMQNLKNYDFHENTQVRKDFGYKKFDPRKDYLVLKEINRRMEESLIKDRGVILDSIHRFNERRKELYEIAQRLGKNVLILECVCSEKEIKKRMKKRPKHKGIVGDVRDIKVYFRFAGEWQNIEEDLKQSNTEHLSYIKYDSEKNIFKLIKINSEINDFVDEIKNIIIKNVL